MPSQRGRTFVVTGTGGLGYEDALALAKADAEVILAGRNTGAGQAAVDRIKAEARGARISFAHLDLSDLASVRRFCGRLASERDALDGLINNAGVMNPPVRMETVDGFELQFGTNYLGHFVLTAGLLPLLRRGTRSRVVTLSSIAAHPGVSRTNLLLNTPGGSGAAGVARKLLGFLFQPVWQGALPTLFAATAPEAKAGGYYGPDRLGETRGYPAEAHIPAPAREPETLRLLWTESGRLTNTSFP